MWFVFAAEYENCQPGDLKEQRTREGFHFGLVSPSRGEPYVYAVEKEARAYWRVADHHSHLYQVDDGFTTATLVECSRRCTLNAPPVVELNKLNQDRVRRAAAAESGDGTS